MRGVRRNIEHQKVNNENGETIELVKKTDTEEIMFLHMTPPIKKPYARTSQRIWAGSHQGYCKKMNISFHALFVGDMTFANTHWEYMTLPDNDEQLVRDSHLEKAPCPISQKRKTGRSYMS